MVYWAMRAAVPLLMGGKVLWDSGVIHRDWKVRRRELNVGARKRSRGWVMEGCGGMGCALPW